MLKLVFIVLVFVTVYVASVPLPKEELSPPPVESSKPPKPSASSSSSSSEEKDDNNARPPIQQNQRRLITFDQRQEGKYNIRADLENFMIVVVPQSASSGLSILDLLTRGALRRNQGKHVNKKASAIHKPEDVKKHLASLEKKSAIEEKAKEVQPIHHQSHQITETDHFIEGRTPYKVDISSSAITDSDASVEIVPSAGKTSASVLKIMKPSSSSSSEAVLPISQGNYRSWSFPNTNTNTDYYEPFYNKQQQYNPYQQHATQVIFRDAKSIPEYNQNSVVLLTKRTISSINNDNDDNDDDDDDINNDNIVNNDDDHIRFLTQHQGFTDLTDTSNSFDSLNNGNIDKLGITSSQYDADWELKLIGAQEQCGPDRRRDSYGICQFVPNID